MTTIQQLLDGMRLPVIAAPMFLISDPKLALACCKAGIVGSFPSLNVRSTEKLEGWLVEMKNGRSEIEKETGRPPVPYAVNLVVHKSNPRLRADLAMCVKHKVPIIITSLGVVPELIEAVHGYGGIVLNDVAKGYHARKATQAGVDGLVAVCAGAGGHGGSLNPFAFVNEIRQSFDGPIFLAGCMNQGSDVAAALAMGADYAYMGTRFINTKESRAIAPYKQMILDSSSGEIITTPAVTGVNCNFMRKSLEENGYDVEKLLMPGKINYGEILTAKEDEAKGWKQVWSAGQGVSGIHDVPSVEELVTRLEQEYRRTVERIGRL